MLDTSNASLDSNVDECGIRRRSTFYVPLSESLDNYLPPPTEYVHPATVVRIPLVSTPAPQRFLLRARKSISKASPGDPKAFNTFPTKAPPRGLGLSKCSSDIDFNDQSSSPSPPQTQRTKPEKSEKSYSSLKLSLPVHPDDVLIPNNMTNNKQKGGDAAMLVKVQAKEIEVCKSPLKGTLSGSLIKKERSFIELSTSKSASRINLISSSSENSHKIVKSNSKSNVCLTDKPTNSHKPLSRSYSKTTDGSLFYTTSKGDLVSPEKQTTVAAAPAPKSPGFSLIRRSHSTKLSRSNSLLKPFTKSEPEDIDGPIVNLCDTEQFTELLKQCEKSEGAKVNLVDAVMYGTLVHGGNGDTSVTALSSPVNGRKSAIRSCLDADEEAVHSDTSYEKACRRGSGGPAGIGNNPVSSSPSRLAAFFFSKKSLRASPLKRARSAAKLAPRTPLRSSRSHESLLSQPAACVDAVVGGTVRPLHASLAGGRAHCFSLHLPGPPPTTRYFACASRLERDTWINNLRASLQPEGGNNARRTERTLRLFLLEAKGLPPKKRYYCEILLDATLYARTSSKLKTDLCFWGEVFEFPGLPHINVITVDVYREPDRKPRKRDKRFLVGSVKIPIHELLGRHPSERWHPILNTIGGDLTADGSPPPSLRIKCRYQTLEVLPLHQYDPLLMYLRDNYTKLLEYLEPIIGVKGKEEVAGALVGTVRGAGGAAAAARLLAVAAALEVRRAPHAALAFRANSLATKATEAYMKMLGETYLQETLWECVSGAMGGGAGGVWEVDPAKGAGAGSGLRRQRARLRTAASRTWRAVLASASRFPPDLKLAFAAFREKLQSMQREELADHIVSASVFLRFLCPAILSPSLFGITHEYPDEKAARNLTLVAKTLQTLANFTRFQGKEAFMEFLNDFLEEEAPNMRLFLKEISTLPPGSEANLQDEWGSGPIAGHLDLGKQLAALHLLLSECVPKLPIASLQELDPLPSILEKITEQLQEPNDIDHSPTIHDNIFRFNDPTYSPCSVDSAAAHSSPLLSRNPMQMNTMSSTSSSQQDDVIGPPKYSTHLLNQLNVRKSPSLGVRAATLPRNNFTNMGTNGNQQLNPDRYSSQYNNREHCVNLKVVQIGLDSKNASSPSLMRKVNGSNGSIHVHSLQRNDQIMNRHNNGNKPLYIENVAARNHVYRSSTEQLNPQNTMPGNLEELSEILRYADEQEAIDTHTDNLINQRLNHEIVPQSNGTHGHNMHNGGSNVSISGLSNVASSGYQSFATYSQSSSPVELYHQNNEGSPAHHVRRPGRNAMVKNSQQQHQRIDYERHKFGIQNFTTDNGTNSPRVITAGPLTFKNPVYHVDDNRNEDIAVTAPPKRSVSTTSSSSIEEEDDTTDNVETNSEENNYRKPKRNFVDSRLSKSNVDPQMHRRLVAKSRSNGSELTAMLTDQVEPVAPLRRIVNARQPRTNPLLSYNNSNQNVTHFGQNNNNNDAVKYALSATRSDSNVEETNKEMFRLQMSRSQKAIYDRNNIESFSSSNIPRILEKYDNNVKNNNIEAGINKNNLFKSDFENNHNVVRITKNGYPLERNYSKGNNVSSTRLNEDPETEKTRQAIEKERDFLDRAVRRLSLEGVGDSSSEQEETYYNTTGRRRVAKNRAIHQYEREIERLKGSVELLRQKLNTDTKAEEQKCGTDLGDSKMKGIITRLLGVEEELRREQQALQEALSKKQRVIEKQGQRLVALGAANARLRSALQHLHPDLASDPIIENLTMGEIDDVPQQQQQNLTVKNVEPKEAEAVHYNYFHEKSPSRHRPTMDTHHQMYHDKGIVDLRNDDDDPYNAVKLTVNNQRNSDPITPRHYHRQKDNMTQQFNQSERSLLMTPSGGEDLHHQAVIATQPAIYYGSNS